MCLKLNTTGNLVANTFVVHSTGLDGTVGQDVLVNEDVVHHDDQGAIKFEGHVQLQGLAFQGRLLPAEILLP